MSKINITVGMRPQIIYRLEARKRDAAGNIVSRRVSADIPNVFTNHGVEVLFDDSQSQSPGTMGYVVGTGSSEPTINDTHLDNFVAGARRESGSDSESFHDNEDTPHTGYLEFRQDALFPVGASGGSVNIAEIGAAFSATTPNASTDLCSRALVVDGNGDPAVFEWLEDEELLLTAFHRRHISLEDIVLTNVPIDGDGPNQDITIRPYGLGFVSGSGGMWNWPGRITAGQPSGRVYWGETYTLPGIMDSSGSSSGSGSGSENISQGQGGMEDYVPGSKERTRWLRVPTGSDRNVVGFQFTGASGSRAFGAWAVKLDPGIPKSDLHRCTFGLTFKIDNTI